MAIVNRVFSSIVSSNELLFVDLKFWFLHVYFYTLIFCSVLQLFGVVLSFIFLQFSRHILTVSINRNSHASFSTFAFFFCSPFTLADSSNVSHIYRVLTLVHRCDIRVFKSVIFEHFDLRNERQMVSPLPLPLNSGRWKMPGIEGRVAFPWFLFYNITLYFPFKPYCFSEDSFWSEESMLSCPIHPRLGDGSSFLRELRGPPPGLPPLPSPILPPRTAPCVCDEGWFSLSSQVHGCFL